MIEVEESDLEDKVVFVGYFAGDVEVLDRDPGVRELLTDSTGSYGTLIMHFDEDPVEEWDEISDFGFGVEAGFGEGELQEAVREVFGAVEAGVIDLDRAAVKDHAF